LPKLEEDSIRQSLFKAIESIKEPGEAPGGFMDPELLPVPGEWVGYRVGVTKNTLEPKISEEEKYKETMKKAISPTTILYFHIAVCAMPRSFIENKEAFKMDKQGKWGLQLIDDRWTVMETIIYTRKSIIA